MRLRHEAFLRSDLTCFCLILFLTLASLSVRLLEALLLIASLKLRVFVGPHEHGSEEASVHGTGVENDGVLLVVSGVGGDGDDRVDSGGQLRETEVVHGASGDQGLLRLVEHVGQGVHPHVKVRDVHAHSLLAYMERQRRRNIMIKKGLQKVMFINKYLNQTVTSRMVNRASCALVKRTRSYLTCTGIYIY